MLSVQFGAVHLRGDIYLFIKHVEIDRIQKSGGVIEFIAVEAVANVHHARACVFGELHFVQATESHTGTANACEDEFRFGNGRIYVTVG